MYIHSAPACLLEREPTEIKRRRAMTVEEKIEVVYRVDFLLCVSFLGFQPLSGHKFYSQSIYIYIYIYMGGRLPAVASMPANQTFLELSAGQSDWPEKNWVVLLPKKRRRPVSFCHEEKRFSLWTAPCLSIKSAVYQVTTLFSVCPR